jgi:outer membrane protein TolC
MQEAHMPRIFLLVTLAVSVLLARPLTLDALLDAVKRSHPSYLAQQESVELQRAKGESELAYPSPVLEGSIAQADPVVGENGLEYSVGVSQTFFWPTSRSHRSRANALLLESQRYRSEATQHSILFAATRDYHDYCLQKEIVAFHRGLLDDEEKMLLAMKRAYEIGGVTKLLVDTTEVELMRDRSHFRHLSHQLGRYAVALSHYWLQNAQPAEPECTDIIAFNSPSLDVLFTRTSENSDIAASKLMSESAAETRQAVASYLPSLDASLFYDNEIDLERTGVALAVPLTFFGETQKKKEFARQKELMAQSRLRETTLRVNTALARLSEQVFDIRSAYNDYAANVVPASKTLMQRYLRGVQLGKLGTTDLMVAKRSHIETIDEMYAIKREFYDRLFELMQLKNIMPGDIQ